jgi:hypothetical protein
MWGTGDFGTSPIFVQLSGKLLLASVRLLGVSERNAQWPIEFRRTCIFRPWAPPLRRHK